LLEEFRKAYGTKRITEQDRNVEYLSYWTDNGAYYSAAAWGEAGVGGVHVNESSFQELATGLQKQDLYQAASETNTKPKPTILCQAVKMIQLDDWFYSGKGGVYSNCVANWYSFLTSSTLG
jgi:hypothetical protein